MRKRIISAPQPLAEKDGTAWLDLEKLAEVEVSSETSAHPIEAALLPSPGSGWEAAEPGEQTIRVHFDTPQRLARIRLHFVENTHSRLQEFTLSWSADGNLPSVEIVRQQYFFSPPGTAEEREDYRVQLWPVKTLQLIIRPEIGGGSLRASLARWQIG